MTAKPLKVALGLSLALNLLLISGIVGAALTWTRIAARPPQAQGRIPLRFAGDGLTPEHRQAFRAAIRGVNRGLIPTGQTARESRREAAALFVQPTFDTAAVLAALARARAADFSIRTQLETAVVGFAAGLPAQERESLADGLRRGGPLRQPVAPRGLAPRPSPQTPAQPAP
jgi:uncharacterized membrane protein